ncbi:hypothetical protein Tco_1057863 [Tanacetum coccineum]|uniref:Uncharacterized protein n=1 Tax=Tanacetum coccineum TaxID=301880 RepID=A0ABQ5H6S4_9ASTR
MSRCTISYESLAKSMGSFVASAIIPYSAPLFSDRVSPAISIALDSDDEPLGSPDIACYYGGFGFSEDDPLEDGPY